MSTHELLMPGDVIVHRRSRGIAVVSMVVALFAGALIGRSTASTTPTLGVRPATALSTLGVPSVGDARRAEMFRAMNGLDPAAIQPATQLKPKDVSPGSQRADMFRALSRLDRRTGR